MAEPVSSSAEVARRKLEMLMGELGTAERNLVALMLKRNEDIETIHKAQDPPIEVAKDRVTALKEEMRATAEPYAPQLFAPRTKTIKLAQGTMSYFRGSESVEIDDQEKLVQAIRANRWAGLLLRRKVTVTVDKLALKKHRNLLEQLKGIVRVIREPEWHYTPGKSPGVLLKLPANVELTD